MKVFKDEEILAGIQNHDHRILNQIYDDILPKIQNMVIHAGGGINQANDIFQEAMIIVYKKVRENNLKLSCKFSTYLYSICKHLWMQEVKYGDRVLSKSYRISDDHLVEEPLPDYKKAIMDIFEKHYEALSQNCQKILELHFQKYTIEEIKTIMGYASSHYAMDKKYRCKKSLIKRIINDPNFKELENGFNRKNRKVS